MREKPILFSGPMVRAILEGRKTQTRRIAKPPRGWEAKYPFMDPTLMADPWETWWWNEKHEHVGVSQVCPYGKPGDHLWVRETLCLDNAEGLGLVFLYKAGGTGYKRWRGARTTRSIVPSIHMPRWASRLTLEVVSVRVERLHDIREADAYSEGIEPKYCEPWSRCTCEQDVIGEYWDLWESINGSGSWDANPWVWVVEFRQLQHEEK